MEIIIFSNYSFLYKCDKIICLSHFTKEDLLLFENVLENMQQRNFCRVSEEKFIQKTDVVLDFVISTNDNGIIQLGKKNFSCQLTRGAYREMEYIVKELLKNKLEGFQWLYNLDTSIDYLLSKDAKW